MAKDRFTADPADNPDPITERVADNPDPMTEPVAPTYLGSEPLNVPVNGAFVRVNTGDLCPLPSADWPGLNPSTWKA